MAELTVVGRSVPRVDALEKVTGATRYAVDFKLPGMLHGRILRSPYPHARIVGIDTSRAEAYPGVRAVVTGKDSPAERFGYYLRERSIFPDDKVRFVGEGVAGVVAESAETADEALALIRVDYEELPAVFNPEEAMKPNPRVAVHSDLSRYTRHIALSSYQPLRFVPQSPNIYAYRPIVRGDVEKGFEEADLVVENRFSCARIHHGAMEPLNATAQFDPDGSLTIWTACTMTFMMKATLCALFGLPPSKVRIINPLIGGSFGARAEAIQMAQASLLALKARRPVKLVLSREEFLLDGGTREPLITYIKDGVKKDGTLVARHLRVITHAGAYCGLMGAVCLRGPMGAVGTYRVPNFKVDSYAVATNEPPATPFRGFGATQVQWAVECQMDMLAEKLEMDPAEIRRRNFLNEGEEDACGQPAHSIGVRECLDRMTEWIGSGELPPAGTSGGPWRWGRGVAVANRHISGGTSSVVLVKVHEDGAVEVRHSAHDQGTGCNTIISQIAAEEFRTSVDRVRLVHTDTARTHYEFGTVASRITINTGNAVRLACQDAKRQLFELASGKLGVPPGGLDITDGTVLVKGVPERALKVSELFTPLGYLVKGGELVGRGVYTAPISSEDLATGQGKRVVFGYAHGASAAEVAVNVETGEVKVLRLGDCFDMGQPINPKLCEGQMDGGRAMGLGSTLSEEVSVRQGKIVTPNYMDYKMPTAADLPGNGEAASYIVSSTPHQDGPYGAKGFSEGVNVPQSPAIASAIYNAVGIRIKDIPITKEKVLEALRRIQ